MTVEELKEYMKERFDALDTQQSDMKGEVSQLREHCRVCTTKVDVNDDKLATHLTVHAERDRGTATLWVGVTIAFVAAMLALLREAVTKSIMK
jgi:hypothetical protein